MDLATLENKKKGALHSSCGEREKVGDTPAVSSVEVKGKRVGGRGKGRRSCFYLWGRYSRKKRLAKGEKGETKLSCCIVPLLVTASCLAHIFTRFFSPEVM